MNYLERSLRIGKGFQMRMVYYSKRVIYSYNYTNYLQSTRLEIGMFRSGVQVSALDLTRLQEMNFEG
jgi:hypothetical protein